MKKPNAVTRSLSALALAAIFGLGVTALVTPVAEADNCRCLPGVLSVPGWAQGASCVEARANCAADARAAARADCENGTGDGVCQFLSLTYTTPCYGLPTRIDCRQEYRCEECLGIEHPEYPEYPG